MCRGEYTEKLEKYQVFDPVSYRLSCIGCGGGGDRGFSVTKGVSGVFFGGETGFRKREPPLRARVSGGVCEVPEATAGSPDSRFKAGRVKKG